MFLPFNILNYFYILLPILCGDLSGALEFLSQTSFKISFSSHVLGIEFFPEIDGHICKISWIYTVYPRYILWALNGICVYNVGNNVEIYSFAAAWISKTQSPRNKPELPKTKLPKCIETIHQTFRHINIFWKLSFRHFENVTVTLLFIKQLDFITSCSIFVVVYHLEEH